MMNFVQYSYFPIHLWGTVLLLCIITLFIFVRYSVRRILNNLEIEYSEENEELENCDTESVPGSVDVISMFKDDTPKAIGELKQSITDLKTSLISEFNKRVAAVEKENTTFITNFSQKTDTRMASIENTTQTTSNAVRVFLRKYGYTKKGGMKKIPAGGNKDITALEKDTELANTLAPPTIITELKKP